MQLGSSSSFELPKSNTISDRWFTQHLLEREKHFFDCYVHLCRTNLRGRNGLPIPKQLRFTSCSEAFVSHLFKKFGVCNCQRPACMNDIVWSTTASYTWELGKGNRACSSESCQLWSLRFHCGLHVWFQDAFCDRVETCVVWIFGCRHVRVLILVTCVSWGPNL